MVSISMIKDVNVHPWLFLLGYTVEVYTNDEKEFTGLFFQYNIMKVTYAACPELIIVDATYKLNELRIPLYFILFVEL